MPPNTACTRQKEHTTLKLIPSKRLGIVPAAGSVTLKEKYTTLEPVPSKRPGRVPPAGNAHR